MKLFIILLLFVLEACAISPGKLTDEDFIIKKYSVSNTMEEAISSLYEGLRYCGPDNGLMFGSMVHYGIPDCPPIINKKHVTCDIYTRGVYGGRGDFVLGRIDFIYGEKGTGIELRAQTWITNSDDSLVAWEQFINNKANEVCPKLPDIEQEEDDFN